MSKKDSVPGESIEGNDYKCRNVEENIFVDAEQCHTIMKSIMGDRG